MNNKNKLLLEAKAFDKIVRKRIKNGFHPDLKRKNIIKYFYNNPWRYPETRYLTISKKVSFVLKYYVDPKYLIPPEQMSIYHRNTHRFLPIGFEPGIVIASLVVSSVINYFPML